MLKEQIAELFLEYRQDLCDTEFAPEPFEQTTDIDLHNRYARKVLALFPQGDKIDGNALPSAAYDEYFAPPQGEGGRWVFKTDKLTPLQVKACVCQQCPFPGELKTKCDWCDNPKMMEFLGLAIPAMGYFFQQHEPLTDEEHEIVNQEREKAHAVEIAIKEQMERVMGVIEEKMEELTSQIKSYQCPQQVPTAYLAQLYVLDALKAELESE